MTKTTTDFEEKIALIENEYADMYDQAKFDRKIQILRERDKAILSAVSELVKECLPPYRDENAEAVVGDYRTIPEAENELLREIRQRFAERLGV